MDDYRLSAGTGRTKINLSARFMGEDLIVFIYNEQAHIGAVAVADYGHKEHKASVSVISRLGHRDDVVAQNAAYKICKDTKKPVCVIAGIHLNNITEAEIKRIVANSNSVVTKLLRELSKTRQA